MNKIPISYKVLLGAVTLLLPVMGTGMILLSSLSRGLVPDLSPGLNFPLHAAPNMVRDLSYRDSGHHWHMETQESAQLYTGMQ